MDDLHALSYVSSATRPLSAGDLDHLLEGARARNRQLGITGMLVHCDGNFMQVLEGPSQAVRLTYARIRRSELHHGLIPLLEEPVPAREFAQWEMACRTVQPGQFKALLGARTPGRIALLRDFAANMR